MTRPQASIALLLALMVTWFAMPAWAVDPVELEDPVLQERYRGLSHELRCMQCQNQSLADSPVSLAGDLRREVRELLLEGRTDAEIRDHLSARYGEFILFRPKFTARTAWLWVAPGALLLLGLFIAFRVIRGRTARAGGLDDDADLPA